MTGGAGLSGPSRGDALAGRAGATLLLLPVLRVTRIHWPLFWRVLALATLGLAVLVGPFVALRGGVTTKPAIARVLGLAEQAQPLALEREEPMPLDQSVFETYRIATARMLEAFRDAVTPLLVPFAVCGLVLASRTAGGSRVWLFLGIVLAASAGALVRLHAVSGYCSATHGLAPSLILMIAAAAGLAWLMDTVSLPGALVWAGTRATSTGPGCLGLGDRPGRRGTRTGLSRTARAGAVFGLLPNRRLARREHSRQRASARPDRLVAVLQQRAGYRFADVYQASADPSTRWIVARQQDVEGPWPYCQVVRELIGGREPAAVLPPHARPHQLQVRIYDRARKDEG